MNFETFYRETNNIIKQWPCDISLYHLHFTINKQLDKIELDDGQIIKVHCIFLPPNIFQKQTVYKNSNIEQIYGVARQLFNRSETIGLIGAKLEVLIKNDYVMPNLKLFPKFNYIEFHHSVDENDCKEQEDRLNLPDIEQFLSYSLKNKRVVSAVRFYQTDANLSENIEVFNKHWPANFLTEVSIYDAWIDNVEIPWIDWMRRQQHLRESTISKIKRLYIEATATTTK